MTLNEYQEYCKRTMNPKVTADFNNGMINAGLGLSGETGEFNDRIKKHLFQGHPICPEHLIKELGDILWYVSLAATVLKVPLDIIAKTNIEKLKKRYPDGFDPAKSLNREEEQK
jgi:NTP pyrophosphatase (non-canonical NTP hydrolase)